MGLIDIKNVTFEYFRRDENGDVEEMIEALRDISLEVKEGEFIAIVGQNGSGKSTLARQINALLLPGQGEVIVDGMDTRDEEWRLSIRQRAGMVFQNPDNQMVGNIVEEDIAFGPENLGVSTEEIWNRVEETLTATDMEEYRTQSPNRLSGGQKQRVAIAGVLAMEPKCIIFDEATAMLDPKGREKMIKLVKTLQEERGITVILITHHMDEVLYADKVFVMKQGEIMDSGAPEYIFSQRELLEECGLEMPPLYQYLYFLSGQEIISMAEMKTVRAEKDLSRLLQEKYGKTAEKAAAGMKTAPLTDREIAEKQAESDMVRETVGEHTLTKGILLNHVSYSYNVGFAHERKVLQDISLGIDKGEFVAVIGHTGSGKSTLLQHLNGLYLPTEGNVYFNGRDIAEKDFPIKELRQKAGMVFQYPEYQLFAETVEQDVCFGPENMDIPRVEAQKRAYEALAAVGLPDDIYDASPLQLSGGQKRRAAIAGVLAMRPEYLILDEPTAGLDPVSAKELLQMLKKLQTGQGMAIVMVSHDMEEVAEYADRVVVLDQGKICMDCTVSEAFGQADLLERLGLSVPVGIKLLKDLGGAGVSVDTNQCRMADICGELMKLQEA